MRGPWETDWVGWRVGLSTNGTDVEIELQLAEERGEEVMSGYEETTRRNPRLLQQLGIVSVGNGSINASMISPLRDSHKG